MSDFILRPDDDFLKLKTLIKTYTINRENLKPLYRAINAKMITRIAIDFFFQL